MIGKSKLVPAAALVVAGWLTQAQAAAPDLVTSVAGQAAVHPGDTVTFLVGYANVGADAAVTPYLDVSIPSGLPAPIDQLTQQQFDELEESAAGTDTLGNTPVLFLDSSGCEHLFFQLQGPSPPDPIQGLDPSAAGAFTFDLAVPMEPPPIGHLTINEPAWLAGELVPALSNHRLYFDNGPTRRFGRGVNCDAAAAGCSELEDCFGPRLSLMPALSSELEVVDDGGAFGDPALGCDSLIGFTAGRIAVMRRGACTFFEKAAAAQAAGAVAAIVVNNGECFNLGPDSPDCVINMDGGSTAGEIDIPVVMLSAADGEEVVAELDAGGTVRMTLGATQGSSFEISSFGFLVDPQEVDPVPANNGDAIRVEAGIFADGLETGDATDWSIAVHERDTS